MTVVMTEDGKPQIKGLESDFIKSLMASSRTRNQYGPRLLEFLESDEAGINPAEVWPEFATKNPATLYQGFNNAAKVAKLTDQLIIIKREEAVFLLNKEKVNVVATDAPADEE